jgi:hypothetical protein
MASVRVNLILTDAKITLIVRVFSLACEAEERAHCNGDAGCEKWLLPDKRQGRGRDKAALQLRLAPAFCGDPAIPGPDVGQYTQYNQPQHNEGCGNDQAGNDGWIDRRKVKCCRYERKDIGIEKQEARNQPVEAIAFIARDGGADVRCNQCRQECP